MLRGRTEIAGYRPRSRFARQALVPTAAALRLGQVALAPLYRLYEGRLLSQVRRHPMPRHVGLILDGNRRYGRQHNVTDPREIYAAGAEKLDDLLSWCADLSIQAITLWVFSTENFDRRPEEVSGILGAIEAKLGSGRGGDQWL